MVSITDNFVLQSPKGMAVAEGIAFVFDFTGIGTPASVTSLVVYDSLGADKSSTYLSGASSIDGYEVTAEVITPTVAGHLRMVMTVDISGNAVISILDLAVGTVIPVATPAVAAASYGTVAGVAAIVPKHANRSGEFNDVTRPTNISVVRYIDQVSSIINAMLASEGFEIPITEATLLPSFDFFVEQEVAAIVEGINGSGRFGPTVAGRRSSGQKSRMQIIRDDASTFIADFDFGIEQMGVTREYTIADGIGYRDTDESGNDTSPIFQREAFGNSYENWDE